MSSTQLSRHIHDQIVTVHFGTRHLNSHELEAQYPSWEFARMHQVHGHNLAAASASHTPEADALIHSSAGLALMVQTADCLPVLAYHTETQEIVALHAGWRGLVPNLKDDSPASLFHKVFQGRSNWTVWIGPHIRTPHFVVRSDVVRQFPDEICRALGKDHFHVDLTALALKHLTELGVKDVWVHPACTFSDSVYHSWRRDRSPGRQWSFIVRHRPQE